MEPTKVPQNMPSDGCTFPGLLKIFKPLLGSDRYHEYCREHDFLRRYDVINWHTSNILLAKRIARCHAIGWVRAPFYYFFTTVSYPFYSDTLHLPTEYREHEEYYKRHFD